MKLLFTALLLLPLLTFANSNASKIKVMLLTGQMNQWHSWEVCSERIHNHLDDAGIFEITKVVTPAKGENMNDFNPDWSAYDVVVLDYDGDDWSNAAQTSFEHYVANGGGFVVCHASDNAFPAWKEFNDMIGVGGWGGRNESAGPMIRWRDGHQVLDFETPGGATHPQKHDFAITVRDTTHPITRDMPNEWLHPWDEIYSRLRGPAKGIHVLATAKADEPLYNATGEHEPMLMTNTFGKGRIFHITLGHVGVPEPEPIKQIQCVGYIISLQRGTEWAATGKVTIPIPADFPTADEISFR